MGLGARLEIPEQVLCGGVKLLGVVGYSLNLVCLLNLVNILVYTLHPAILKAHVSAANTDDDCRAVASQLQFVAHPYFSRFYLGVYSCISFDGLEAYNSISGYSAR